jgi:RalA-binding protein 1
MTLRYPIFIRWSPYIEESLELLSTSPDSLPTDAWLCDLIRLQHIAENATSVFSMDDPAFIVSFLDTKTQYHVDNFKRQLDQWRRKSKSDLSKRKAPLPPPL